jgi:hypothetical protein
MPFIGADQPTVTISSSPSTLSDTQVLGSGAEEDVKIIFDGNAVDYHIGCDDSADALVMGKGSTLGTTTSQSFDSEGIILRPLQPAFLVNGDTTTGTNLTKDAYRTESMGEEIFDTNGDFSTDNDTFTAPVTGIYKLKGQYRFEFLQNDANYLMELVTSDNTFVNDYNHDVLSGDMDFSVFEIMADVPMDAGDTATLQWKQVGGTQDVDKGSSDNPNQINTYMSGFLIG